MPNYDRELIAFIDEVSKTDILQADYLNILDHYSVDQSNLNHALDTANLQTTQAILTLLVRQERFSDGAWGTSAREGTFEKVLLRLKELTN